VEDRRTERLAITQSSHFFEEQNAVMA